MPAVSKKQQKFMGIVRSIQKGEQPASKFDKDAQDVAKDMKKKDVKDFASTKHKGLPVKKEILNKLKEMIRQELSEYTYGVGDIVKDVNPTCLHYGAIGKVKEVNPKYVKFVVMNNGDRFKKGQTLEKSHDQMKKMNENKVVKVKALGDRKYKLTPLNSIPQIEKLAYNGRVSYRGLGVFGAKVFELSINTKVWHASSLKQEKQYFISSSDLDKLKKKVDDSPFLAGGLPFSGTLKGWKPIKPDDRVGIVSNLKESINEFSMKLQKSTRDMVDALLKVKNPMPKEIESALIMMAKGYGLDYVKKEVQRDAKGFYKNLKQMAAAFPEFRNKPKDYKFESIIQERNDEVQTGKDYTKLWLQSIGLIIKQANSLKGPLAKHPVKRDLNKLKAVESLFKKFVKPAIETERASSRHYAPNQTELKKYLSNSKFKVAIRILRQTIESSNGYNENSWYDLDDKTTKLIKKMGKVLYDIEDKMEKANLESVNENLRPSDKKILMVIATELVKTQMKGKNKNQVRKELPDILSTMGTNDFSKKSPTNRFNKNKMISLGKGFDKLSDYDKKVFINTLMYNAGLTKIGHYTNEAKEPEVITQLRDIVKRKQFKNIKDPKTKKTIRVDMFTANAITQVYDAIKKNSSHKSKFESLPLGKMASLSFKMMK